MILYHGSSIEIAKPDVVHSRARVVFGPGFYTTTLFDQAAKWSKKFKSAGCDAVVSKYICNEEAYSHSRVLTFNDYSKEWLDFVVRCRKGNYQTEYEIISGGVANDRVFNTVELFLEGLIDEEEALGRLRFEKPNWQICFRTQEAVDRCLAFEESVRL